MGRRGCKQKPALHIAGTPGRKPVSPDDVLHLMQERDRQATLDTRTDAQRWLGDPPPYRSALAQRNSSGTSGAH
jgi:hypothetical protein